MGKYNKFKELNVFADSDVNNWMDIIFDHVYSKYPDKQDDFFIGGGVGLILQGKKPYLIKDVDIIVTDRAMFIDLTNDIPNLIEGYNYKNYLRFWLKTSKIWLEFWYVDKTARLVDYNGIKLELDTDILKYK